MRRDEKSAWIEGLREKWYRKASGAIQSVHPEFDLFFGGFTSVGRAMLKSLFLPNPTTNTFNANAANNVALEKDFKETKKFGYQHNQKVYKYKGKYYSKDIDNHNGGVWKVFEEKHGRLERIGTADKNLKILKK